MSKPEKICIGVLIALVVFALAARIVLAEDNDLGFCTNPKATNYVGNDAIQAWKDAGYNVVDDGSCECMKITADNYGNVLSADSIACDDADNSFNEWLDGTLYGPAYYGKPIEVGGCTDPAALNWMDPQWWVDYSIVDDGSCVYPELETAL